MGQNLLERLDVRHERELLSSLLLDVAHGRRTEPSTYSHLIVTPGQFPTVVRRDGHQYTDLTRDPVTIRQSIGLMVAASGPTNPLDGPCGSDDDGNILYWLRGTDMNFVLGFERAGVEPDEGYVVTIRLWEAP